MTTHPLVAQLDQLPDSWGFVAVGQGKRPYQPEWQKNPLTREQLAAEITAGRAAAIGVLAGPQSGGLLFVDHDGISAGEILDQIGVPLRDLPKSWAVTSGRNGRLQIIYRVPEQFWPELKTRKLKTGKFDDEGKPEQLELRWAGCQSVVAGAHPTTGAYRWLKGRSPSDLPLAEAPIALIEQMLPQEPIEPTPLLPLPRPRQADRTDSDWARIWLDALSSYRADDYDYWIEVGQCLHSVGDPSLLGEWDAWSRQSPKWEPGACEYHWRSFKADGKRDIRRLCNLAKEDGWKPAERRSEPLAKRAKASTVAKVEADADAAPEPTGDKLQKVEADQLLAMLRKPEKDGSPRFRYNVFTQQIEIRGKVAEGVERFYLQLAETGYKVSKEMAMDCLVQVARENPYDPVKLYLEHVEAQVAPTYIDRLASTYLRPGDAQLDQPTLYDHMLKATLIGAVRRVFQPGCKHDNACVLMGDQGARKSSFWAALGGPFFSDALRDISSKDDLMVLHRSWIMEWAELDHITSKKHAGQVKAFLSQSTDLFRVPYGKATEDFRRRCIIVGSTNRDSGFLVDETGNRRFWVVPVTCTLAKPIDVPNLLLERDAIWAAAVAAYRQGESNDLALEHQQAVEQENQSYLVTNPWQSAVEGYLARRVSIEPLTTEEILLQAIQKPLERQTRGDQMQVASILRDLGWIRKRESGGRRRWFYTQP
ncbi:MAG: VapE domain-containing protein [Cyanobium sp.]|nr:VapE domain-containing protein [Cyanobium sp.]